LEEDGIRCFDLDKQSSLGDLRMSIGSILDQDNGVNESIMLWREVDRLKQEKMEIELRQPGIELGKKCL